MSLTTNGRQRHLIRIGALVRQEAAPLLTLGSRTTWIHDRDEQLGAGMEGGVRNGTSVSHYHTPTNGAHGPYTL